MKIAFADCFSGVSGDMFLAALLDAGLPLERLRSDLAKLNLSEPVDLRLAEVHRGALRASHLEVLVPHSHQHRHLADIQNILSASQLSSQVKQTVERVFTLLAEAEAHVHGEPVEKIHFHEVGALDSIVDVVGAVIGLEALGIERLYASPLPYNSGTIESAHGVLPLPAPATLEIMKLANIPLTPSTAQVELVTPTGAALLGTLATFTRPGMVLSAVGIGAGKRELEWPNIMRLMIGETPATTPAEMVQIETNIDDMNPQFYGHIIERLFSAGAVDVYLTPIQMKKNRPGTLLGVIAYRRDEPTLAEIILKETTTLGLRVHPIYRYEAQRQFSHVHTCHGDLTIKQKIINGQIMQSIPEYEDCVRLARENNVSLDTIYSSFYQSLGKTGQD